MKTVEQLAREAGPLISTPFDKWCENFYDLAIAQYRESLLAEVGEPEPCKYCGETSDHDTRYCCPAPSPSVNAQERISELEAQIEQLQVQLAGCGVAALQNTEKSRALRAVKGEYGYSESYAEVCRAVDREIDLREQNAQLLEQFELVLRNLEKGMSKSIQKLVAKESREVIAIAAVEGKV